MSVLQYLRLHGCTPCRGVVAASGVVPCYDESQAQCVMSMPQARQCCSRSVGLAVWGMGDGQCERVDLDSCSGCRGAACSSVARATLGRDFMAKIAASSMKSPIFTAARAYIELSLACGSLDCRGVLCQKVGLCLLFFIISQAEGRLYSLYSV